MQLDPSQPQSTWRAPRLRLLANGNVILGACSIDATSNNHYAADRISGDISLSADPAYGVQWWASQTDVILDAQIALPNIDSDTPSWQSVIVATVDQLRFDIDTMQLRFDGRDLSARFIETKIQETFSNQTSSHIAQTLAARHGLSVSTKATSTIVGQYYQLEHDRVALDNFSHQTTEWDLLTFLAQEEGYDVWVKGNTLYFLPPSANTNPPFKIVYSPGTDAAWSPQLNVERISLERSLTLAKDIQVTVKSSNLKSGQAFTRTVRGSGAKAATSASGNGAQQYVFTKPGLTPDQALKMAQQKLGELSRHERVLNVEMPGETDLTSRDTIVLSGTQSSFDQLYYVEQITRSLSFGGGFTQHVRAKNTSPRTQTTVL